MADLTANRGDVGNISGPMVRFGVDAEDIIFRGAMVGVDAGGHLIIGGDTSGLIWIGVAMEDIDATGDTSGDQDCLVAIGGGLLTVTHTGGSQTVANIGDEIGLDGDQDVDVVGGLVNNVLIGRVVKIISATKVVVMLYPFATQT